MRLSWSEKLPLVVLGIKLKVQTGRTIKVLGDVIRIVKPKPLIQWHKQLVWLKWPYQRCHRGGRPLTDRDLEQLVLRLARENDWGSERDTSPSWRHLMTHYKDQLLACDFFTVETLFLHTIYALIPSHPA